MHVFTPDLAKLPLKRLVLYSRSIPADQWVQFCARCTTLEELHLRQGWLAAPSVTCSVPVSQPPHVLRPGQRAAPVATAHPYPHTVLSVHTLPKLRTLTVESIRHYTPTAEWNPDTLRNVLRCSQLQVLTLIELAIPHTLMSDCASQLPRLQRIALPRCTIQFPDSGVELNPRTSEALWVPRKRPRFSGNL
jgi:hypothetical protein